MTLRASSKLSRLREQMVTSKPSIARRRATALPIPLLEATTIAFFPRIPRSISTTKEFALKSEGRFKSLKISQACKAAGEDHHKFTKLLKE
jgi:hypothetical protein